MAPIVSVQLFWNFDMMFVSIRGSFIEHQTKLAWEGILAKLPGSGFRSILSWIWIQFWIITKVIQNGSEIVGNLSAKSHLIASIILWARMQTKMQKLPRKLSKILQAGSRFSFFTISHAFYIWLVCSFPTKFDLNHNIISWDIKEILNLDLHFASSGSGSRLQCFTPVQALISMWHGELFHQVRF